MWLLHWVESVVLFIELNGQIISVAVKLSRMCVVVHMIERAGNQCDCYTE